MSHFVRFYITIPEKKLKTPSILNEVFIKESVLIRSCIIGRKKKTSTLGVWLLLRSLY